MRERRREGEKEGGGEMRRERGAFGMGICKRTSSSTYLEWE